MSYEKMIQIKTHFDGRHPPNKIIWSIIMDQEVENRRHTRVNARWPLTVLSQHRRIEGETRNISVSGVLIKCDEPLYQNEFLRLALEPPHKTPIWVSGEIVWSDSDRSHQDAKNYAMGFSFVEISDVDKVLLKDLVALASAQ
jgi:hypothetical protein